MVLISGTEPSALSFDVEAGGESPVEMESPNYEGRAVDAILGDIEDMLGRDPSVTREVKKDMLSDLATLRIQLARNVKSKAVIGAILENLSGIPSIAPLLTALKCIVFAYYN